MKRWGGGGVAFIIPFIINFNNFSSKLFSELKFGIAYFIPFVIVIFILVQDISPELRSFTGCQKKRIEGGGGGGGGGGVYDIAHG